MMASSTKRPKEMISAPRDTLWRSMPKRSMAQKTPAKTSGMHPATTKPVRIPRLKKLTAKTMTTASRRVLINSSMECSTTAG